MILPEKNFTTKTRRHGGCLFPVLSSPCLRASVVFLASNLLAATTQAATGLALRVPAVAEPTSPIDVFLDLTTDRTKISAAGARLSYDPTKVTLSTVQKQAGLPASWSFIYLDTATAGKVDLVLTDQTTAAAVLAGPASAIPAVKLTFNRVSVGCGTASFDFNAAAPAAGAQAAAFPQNQYIIYVAAGGAITLEAATGAAATGPVTSDHGFIRGNVNNRSAHALDIGDVVDLVNNLFGTFVPAFDCAAAFDTNNDGARNIVDVVALVQAAFGSQGVVVAPPSAANPGPGIPGVVVPNGGTIPSSLGCNQGERCP